MNNYFNKLMSVFALLVASLAVNAENAVKIAPLEITPGETKTVSVEITSDVTISAAQFDITLPDGLTLVEGTVAKVKDRLAGKHVINYASPLNEDGTPNYIPSWPAYRFMIYAPGSIIDIAGNSGAVMTFDVKAATNIGPAKKEILISKIELSDMENTAIYPADSKTDVTIKAALNGEVNLAVSAEQPIVINSGETATISVELNNADDPLSALEGYIELPEGLEIVGSDRDGYIQASNRVKVPGCDYTASNGYFYVMNTAKGSFNGTSGELFSFEVKASDNLAAETEIKLTKLVAANVYTFTFDLDDLVIKVKNETAVGINAVEAQKAGAQFFTADGKRVAAPVKGLNVVKYNDGTTKKVIK